MNYYKNQLDKINMKGGYSASVKFSSVEDNTNWMELNTESAQIIVERLVESFELVYDLKLHKYVKR